MSAAAMDPIRGPGYWWSLALGIAALARGTAYASRPPTSTVSTPVEALMPWSLWAVALGACGLLILAGVLAYATARGTKAGRWLGWAGHVLGCGLYLTIGTSYLAGAITGGATWSGVAPVLIIAALHQACADRLGQEIRHGH